MENYRGIYSKNSKNKYYFEGGAHFRYKDLYNKLVDIYNKRTNNTFPQKYYNLNLSPRKNKSRGKISDNTIKMINKHNGSSKSKKKTRNKKINNNFSNSDSLDNNHYKNINLNISNKSNDNNNFNIIYYDNYNDIEIFNSSTSRFSYYNIMLQKNHHNSINKNYSITNRKNKKNLSFIKKPKEMSSYIKTNQIDKSLNNSLKNNNLKKYQNKTIYNYCYLKYENNYSKKIPQLKTNNIKRITIFNIGKFNYKYNLYDNIYLKNKIKSNLKQLKYNSFIKENSVNKNSSSISKIKDKSKNNFIKSIDKIYNEKKLMTNRLQCHIKSVDYASMYLGILNEIKTPSYKIKNEIFNKNSKISSEPICKVKNIWNNKKNYEALLKQINKNTSYAKIKKNHLSFTKSKKRNNKEISKERKKRYTQSTEYK